MAHDVVLIPGDGIGPEITQAMRRVVEATGVQINWNVQEAGAGVMDRVWHAAAPTCARCGRRDKVAIKGPITTPVGTGFRSVNVALRKHFDLYACVRPCLSQPATARASATSTWSSCARTPRTSTPASSSMRALPRSRSSRSLSSVRAKRPSPPIPRSRSSRFPSPRAAALWSMPLSMPAAAAAKR